jgi:antitoxin component YwqK of YwqJK toxin-antitoxin module
MKKLFIFNLIFISLLTGCVDNDEKKILTDTWACPKNATLQTWKDGYPGEKKKFMAIGCIDKRGNRVGYHIAWRDYGLKEHEGSFINDIPNGEWSYYHKNGALYRRGFFKDGKREGIWSAWDENGKFQYDERYRDGNLIEKLHRKT